MLSSRVCYKIMLIILASIIMGSCICLARSLVSNAVRGLPGHHLVALAATMSIGGITYFVESMDFGIFRPLSEDSEVSGTVRSRNQD